MFDEAAASERAVNVAAPALSNAVTMSSAMSGSSSTMRMMRPARLVLCTDVLVREPGAIARAAAYERSC